MLEKIRALLKERFPDFDLTAAEDDLGRGIVTVAGQVDTWQSVVNVGHAVAKIEGVHNVVSDMTVKDLEIPKKDYAPIAKRGREIGVIDEADVVIIGLGIVGCATARTLAKHNLRIIAVEMSDDVATGATKANNGGVHHAGAVKPGTLKAKLSVRGNRMYDQWARELNFDWIRPGALNMAESVEDMDGIYERFKVSVENGDWRPAFLDGPQTLEIEPRLKDHGQNPVAAVYLPSQGKVHPFEASVAMIENAVDNGVKVYFNAAVGEIIVEDGRITGVVTERGIIKTSYVINCAGVYSDEIAEMAGDRFFTIHPRRGTLVIIDKHKKPMYDHLGSFHVRNPKFKRNVESKGGGMDFTPSYNILLGPSAMEMPDKEDTETTRADLDYAMSRNQNPEVSEADIIRIFAGTRPADFKEDYVVEASPVTRGLITAGAVQSPGIGSAPAVAEMVEDLLKADLEKEGKTLIPNPGYNPYREKRVRFHELSREEQDELIKKNPAYGNVVCRCETITEGEIVEAISSSVVPTSIDAIKRRVRAGMGRCQGGFCQPRVLAILARELGQDWVDINLDGRGTQVVKARNREGGQS
ncbi:MAG: FAD-dependent oxidoreductase [Christensenellales bacterium]|jgi:glycerol-3-phosphate dehydrogenase